MIRVLLAEDSATCRALLTAALETDPQLRIVGQAHDGAAAVSMTDNLRPQVVVMDANMPVMDGFEATRQIMLRTPTPIVIVSASVDTEAVASSMRALQAGALTLLPKPVSPAAEDFDEITRQFVGTVRAMADVKVVRRFQSNHSITPARATNGNGHGRELVMRARPRVRVIGIAASTGGPAALHRVLSDMPASLSVPVLVVQHIARGFVQGLASWLSAVTPFSVQVAEHGDTPLPGRVYIAPDDRHLAIAHGGAIDLTRTAAVGGFVPSASVLFASLAQSHGASTLGLIMTGMGQDGVDGLRELHRTGATVLAQDEETSVVFGMPGAAVDAGVTDAVLPLPTIGARLAQLVRAEG